MIPLSALWLPIIVSAVAVFIVSSIIHMVSPWHKGDYPKLSNEDALAEAVRPLNLPPGDYMVPRPGGAADMKSDAFKEKVNRGPNLILTVIRNGPRPMSTYLLGWFIYILVVTIISAHIGGALAGAGDRHFGIHGVGIIAFIGYTLALFQMSIWYHRKWSTTLKTTLDGLIYAVVTFLIFASFWPQ